MNTKEQNKLAGIFLMIHGGFQAFVMVLLGVIYGGMGAIIFASAKHKEEQTVGVAIIVGMIVVIAIALAAFILPQIIGGWKMFKERPNARIWGVVGSIIACFSVPFGTAAGVFGLIFLLSEEGQRFYLGGGQQPQNMFIQPPPHNWQ